MTEKKKILIIADSPLAPSGVGTQTRYMIEGLLKTGKYQFLCLAGAIKHNDYRIHAVSPYEEDWLIKPVDGYGDPNTIRAVLRDYKPDLLWFMTDPRFYVWLWGVENEVRVNCPMVYYHVWDNYPYPMYNEDFYNSNDVVCTISKVTDDIVRTVAPNVECVRIPHTVDTDIFKKMPNDSEEVRKTILGDSEDKLIFFWNNRNARRKQSGTLIYWFKEFLDKVGYDKAMLLMHTEPNDPNGQDLQAIVSHLGLSKENLAFSTTKLPPSGLAKIYAAADCTINISDAEGFGLATLESLATETPIIVTMTGGLQEQVTNGEDWFGYGIDASSKSVIGSQDVPYIHEDRINKNDFLLALTNFYELTKEQREEIGRKGRQHVIDNYSLDQYNRLWEETIERTIEHHGSWENRKNYKSWTMEEL